MSKTVAITGVMGFIGGVTALALKDLGHKVIGIDKFFDDSFRHCIDMSRICDTFVKADYANYECAQTIMDTSCDAIIHLGGTSLVGPSITRPLEYYSNNVAGTIEFLRNLHSVGWKQSFIFSSSAAVYGNPGCDTITEKTLTNPISAYGSGKLMIEHILTDWAKTSGLASAVSLRYFNACGADHLNRWGQYYGASHIIPRIMEHDGFTIYGTDYDTEDGTCIRDYIHVEDIADAHIKAMEYSFESISFGKNEIFNLGSGVPYSIMDVIKSCEKAMDTTVDVSIGDRRIGDPDRLLASSKKFKKATFWKPRYTLDETTDHVWGWTGSDAYNQFKVDILR